MEKTISLRQFSLIAFISILSLKLTVLPSLIYQEVKWDAFFVILFFGILEFILFGFAFYILKKNQDTTLHDFLSRIFGKVIAKIIIFSLFCFFLLKILNLIDGGYSYAREVIFQESPLSLFIFIFLTACGSMYLFKLRSYGRTVEFFYPIIFFLFLIFIVIAMVTAKMFDLRPFFESGSLKIFETIFQFNLPFVDSFILLLFMGKIKFNNDKSDKKAFAYIGFSIFIVVFFYYVYNSVFKYTAFLHPNAISEIVQFLPLPTILGNFDWLAITLMMILFLLQGGLFTFGMCESLTQVAQVREESLDTFRKIILGVCYAIVLIFIYFIFKSFDEVKSFSVEYGSFFGIYLVSLQIVLFITQLFITAKEQRKEEKNEKMV